MYQRTNVVTDDPAEDEAASAAVGEARRIRWLYPICAGLPLIVVNCGWIAHSEMKTGVTEITISTFFMGVAFLLFLITLLNGGVRRWFGARAAMNQPELMALYAMLSMSSVVAGIGNLGFFTPFLVNAFWYASPSNAWSDWWPLLPGHIGPRDREILKGFYEGRSTFFQPEVMAAWAYPLIAWGLFFLVLIWTTMCLAALLRRRWEDEEHLPFPVIALPLEMTRDDGALYRKRLFWLGFVLPCALHTLNTLNSMYPSLPALPINKMKDLVPNLSYPWTGLGSITYLLHPSAVGFGYLVNTDVLFSLWFFYLLKKSMNLVGVLFNWRDADVNLYGDQAAQFPFTGYQAWGAWLAVSLTALWTGRRYFRAYWERAWNNIQSPEDKTEAMSPRMALVGFLTGFFILCAFVWSSGASWWLPFAFLGIYVLIMVALSRLLAETAVLSPLLAWVDPQSILPGLTGTRALSRVDLAHMGMLTWFNLDYRAAPMPQMLQNFVGMKRAGGGLRPLVGVMLLAAAVAIIAALLWDLQLYYVNGAATGNINRYRINMGNSPWGRLDGWLDNPKLPERQVYGGMAAGAGITALLAAVRARFVGFPLSPAAYVLNVSWANELFWCDMFVAWIITASFLRYGGMRLYLSALPFFLGIILGDFVTGSFWSIFGTFMRLELFRTFPN